MNCEADHKHPRCQSPAAKLLPRRIIDVGTDLNVDGAGLYESRGERAQYVALSHYWGARQNFTTTKATLDQRKQGFFVRDMAETFRDAVTCIRKLGIRF